MRVVIAGSSVLIGTALVADLRAAGHDVVRLVRRTPGARQRGWDPAAGRIDAGTFDGVDAVVGLGGVPIGDGPWSGARKQLIRDSRNVPTEVLATAVAEHGVPIFLGRRRQWVTTATPATASPTRPGRRAPGFLAEVCRGLGSRQPEGRDDGGARVVTLRTGLVLAPGGRAAGASSGRCSSSFLGGRLGYGTQYMPWISLDDEVGGIRHALEHDAVVESINLTGATAVTNAEFTKALAEAVHRPTSLPVPGVRDQRRCSARWARSCCCTASAPCPPSWRKPGTRYGT